MRGGGGGGGVGEGGEGGSWGHNESQTPWEKQQQHMHKFMKK